MGKKLWFYSCFLRDITDPPITDRIPNSNPAIGNPVCCIGIVVAFVVTVELVGVIWVVGVVEFVGFALFNVRVSEDTDESNTYDPAFTVFPVTYK